MGARLSLTIFEFINDVHIAIGSGLLGISIHLYRGMNTETFKTLCIGGLTSCCLMYTFSSSEKISATPQKAVFITGCDSGLGFSFAYHLCDLGFTVIAGCLSLNSEGARQLEQTFPGSVLLVELDVTKTQSIRNALITVDNILASNAPCELWALINNAGVMVFGEFEWLTERLIRHQLEVNLHGTMILTQAFLPMLRKFQGRIITVSSHCAYATLPGLAVYGATKAALSGWSDGLRTELGKYGVKVITFIPGSFVQQSNIMSKQNENVFEMQSTMTDEQLNFYGEYFKEYNMYLNTLSGYRKLKKIDDPVLYEKLENAVMEKSSKAVYINEPWRYKIFHFLFKITPYKIRDYLVIYFVHMPKWEQKRQIKKICEAIA